MADYRAMARAAARRHGLNPDVFERQIDAESAFNPGARSQAGAVGIAQIMPATARGWGVNPANPRASLNAAAKHMAGYVRQFGSYEDALRAYNAGPGNVRASRGFGETNAYVHKILRGSSGSPAAPIGSGGAGGGDGGTGGTTTTTRRLVTPPVNNAAARAALAYSFLSPGRGSRNLLDFAGQIGQLADVPAQYATDTRTRITQGATGGDGGPGGSSLAQTATARADVINRQRLPYQWGGGHAGKTPIHDAVPLDCSGAVSKVLGIDPRVSGDFAKWGRPGDGGSKGVTVYSNKDHVLMKINGKFFGTSASNPGGGAGWIEADNISPQYLQNFTARHSER